MEFFNTVKYLKYKQVYFRIYYLLRGKFRKTTNFQYPIEFYVVAKTLNLVPSINPIMSYENNTFKFLNISHKFDNEINWNLSDYGKLWTYNLTYFDFLNQKDFLQDDGLRLINDFIKNTDIIKDGLEPFPISLRGINWIKFLTKFKINDKEINNSLYRQYMILIDNLEYHLLGNHLLENTFSLLFGAYYFEDENFYTKAKKLLVAELNEQTLDDGAHFELSPMYHQIMLHRVLDCINLLRLNRWKEDELLKFLTSKAKVMLGWLHQMTYKCGDIPLFNDSANMIAPTTSQLNKYAEQLNITPSKVTLKQSGYRKYSKENYELIVDVGNIGPDYIPGHAHSDTFSFELYIDNKPFIIDTGLSTYETNERRILERSTNSHNTVMVGNKNQSEVWSGFRVANRAKIVRFEETTDGVKATHDGYNQIGVLHTRQFTSNEDKIVIEDTIESNKMNNATAFIHFYPDLEPLIESNIIKIKDVIIELDSNDIQIEEYLYAPEFNKLIPAKMIRINFQNSLKMEINI